MMRIADLLNTSTADTSATRPRAFTTEEDFMRASLVATGSAVDESSSSHDEYEQDENRLSTSSLFGAMTLTQTKLALQRSPTAVRSQRSRFMTITNITNPTPPPTETTDAPATEALAKRQSKKRSTRSLHPTESEIDRRTKQRLIVKRCYYKKINTIKTLRSEADELETHFRAVLRERQREEARKSDPTQEPSLSELYLQTLDVKESLRKENIRLRRLADEYYMKNQGRVRVLLEGNYKDLILFRPALDN